MLKVKLTINFYLNVNINANDHFGSRISSANLTKTKYLLMWFGRKFTVVSQALKAHWTFTQKYILSSRLKLFVFLYEKIKWTTYVHTIFFFCLNYYGNQRETERVTERERKRERCKLAKQFTYWVIMLVLIWNYARFNLLFHSTKVEFKN